MKRRRERLIHYSQPVASCSSSSSHRRHSSHADFRKSREKLWLSINKLQEETFLHHVEKFSSIIKPLFSSSTLTSISKCKNKLRYPLKKMQKKLNQNNRSQFPLLYVGLKKFMFYTEILSQNFDYNAVNFPNFSTIISLKKIKHKSCQKKIFTMLSLLQ